ncbi:hypothetical protein [Paenibacillus sp. FSL H7-0326]|uniref:hypothetical protein n=1 Tax=Paenibacillus sp. FSL H7-0326 TaxID=1921144 RepID=UPI0015C3A5FD|nr:hypothetical protein [Paenibacillus sp. FSL H7-0326]
MKPSKKIKAPIGNIPVTKSHRFKQIVAIEAERESGKTATAILEELIKKEHIRQFGRE